MKQIKVASNEAGQRLDKLLTKVLYLTSLSKKLSSLIAIKLFKYS